MAPGTDTSFHTYYFIEWVHSTNFIRTGSKWVLFKKVSFISPDAVKCSFSVVIIIVCEKMCAILGEKTSSIVVSIRFDEVSICYKKKNILKLL